MIRKRKAKDNEIVRLFFYRDRDEFVVYKGKRVFAIADNPKDAYKLFNEA